MSVPVLHGDPSVTLPAFHSPPPAQEIQGALGAVRTGRPGAKAQDLPKNFPWVWARKHSSGLEYWQQHPHWGLTSAASLEDACPRALGH